MEDRRIRKTKKILKNTMISLLGERSFEKISVTELCSRAEISRITFYTHYDDKYMLVEEIFQDMITSGTANYELLQKENNPSSDPIQSFCNVLDSILSLYYGHFDFFHHTIPGENPYLAFSFYHHVLNTVEMHTKKDMPSLQLKYSPRQITGFLCYGLLGFINESHQEKLDLTVIRTQALDILNKLLSSGILGERDRNFACGFKPNEKNKEDGF